MKLSWVKLWIEIIYDPKVLQLDYPTRWFIIDCFGIAGTVNEEARLGSVVEIELILPRGETGVKKKLSTLSKIGIVHEKKGVWYLTNWSKRQGKPSDQPGRVAERVKKSRGKKPSENETPLNRHEGGVTGAIQKPCNAIESPQKRTEENRTEKD